MLKGEQECAALAGRAVAGLWSERKWLFPFSCDSFMVKLVWIIRFKCVHKAACSNKAPVKTTLNLET